MKSAGPFSRPWKASHRSLKNDGGVPSEFPIPQRKGEKGIALLTVIWVLTILMVIVLSFSFMARTETLSTLAFKEGTEKRFWAEAGLERGLLELFFRKVRGGDRLIGRRSTVADRRDPSPRTDRRRELSGKDHR